MKQQTTQETTHTKTPDDSARILKAAGQFWIIVGFVVFAICIGCGIATAEDTGALFFIIGFILLIVFELKGARSKSTAKAAIEAQKTSERTERMEQMMAQMMANGDSGFGTQGQKCPKCGANTTPGAKFCPSCGNPTNAICAQCGKSIPSSSKFCPECGAANG